MRGATRLDDWGVIRAAGADAASFLHNQLTNDVLALDGSHARLAGFCTAKGRMQASFVMWRGATDEILLACSADLLAPALKRLSMFVLRSKCKLTDASGELALWGVAGDAALAAPQIWSRTVTPDGDTLLRLPDALLGDERVARALWVGASTSAPVLPALAPEAWRWLEVHSATARIVAATHEKFVPQMINFELVGGVNFQKGCYPGQEIVARSQYRGTVKRRAYVVHADTPLAPGQDVFAADDLTQPAGMVVLAASLGARHAALVELKIAAASGELRSASVDGARLTLAALPYAIPTEPA